MPTKLLQNMYEIL